MIPRDDAERIATKICDGWHWENEHVSTISKSDFWRYLVAELRAEMEFTECVNADCRNPPMYCSTYCSRQLPEGEGGDDDRR